MLIRSKVDIQNQWLDWFADHISGLGLTDTYRTNLKSALAQEVSWLIYAPDAESNISLRIAKINSLVSMAEDGDISAFDPYWEHRLAILQWMLT